MDLRQSLAGIVEPSRVSDNPDILNEYARDYSFGKTMTPSHVVYPLSTDEVQGIIKLANEHKIPVTPRSSKVSFYGASIPSKGGIVIDLSRMDRILEIDPRNKKVKVEPGVTWAQVQAELGKQGMMVANPLLPHREKSLLTSAMEREPILITKNEYSETLLTAEIVLPNGELFWTGTALGNSMKGQTFPDAVVPAARLWQGAQGTLGIATWANLKAEFLPTRNKMSFISSDSITKLIDPLYKIQRLMLGNECLILNNTNLATILANDWPDEFLNLREKLPPWTIILCLSALHRRPEEKIAYEEEALVDLASELHFEVLPTVAGITGLDSTILNLLRKPWPKDIYWKFRHKGARQDIFFHTTLERTDEFIEAVYQVAAKYEYPQADIGVYLQPLERARACFCEFGLPYRPDDTNAIETVRKLFLEASEKIVSMGGLFTTPYHVWADMVYRRTEDYSDLLKLVKNIYDPSGILNPGKLGF